MHFFFADALTSREKNDKLGWKRVCHKEYIKGVGSNQLITACRVCRARLAVQRCNQHQNTISSRTMTSLQRGAGGAFALGFDHKSELCPFSRSPYSRADSTAHWVPTGCHTVSCTWGRKAYGHYVILTASLTDRERKLQPEIINQWIVVQMQKYFLKKTPENNTHINSKFLLRLKRLVIRSERSSSFYVTYFQSFCKDACHTPPCIKFSTQAPQCTAWCSTDFQLEFNPLDFQSCSRHFQRVIQEGATSSKWCKKNKKNIMKSY